jgi:hypothetical protein
MANFNLNILAERLQKGKFRELDAGKIYFAKMKEAAIDN